jgi:hypothetical protein
MANRLTAEEKADREIHKNMHAVRGFTVPKKILEGPRPTPQSCAARAGHDLRRQWLSRVDIPRYHGWFRQVPLHLVRFAALRAQRARRGLSQRRQAEINRRIRRGLGRSRMILVRKLLRGM